jgi:hypothetical protein
VEGLREPPEFIPTRGAALIVRCFSNEASVPCTIRTRGDFRLRLHSWNPAQPPRNNTLTQVACSSGQLNRFRKLIRVHMQNRTVRLPCSNPSVELDGCGDHESVIVVGVFADQINAARCSKDSRTCPVSSLEPASGISLADPFSRRARGCFVWPPGFRASVSEDKHRYAE